MDVVVDLRLRPNGTEELSLWLVDRGFELAGVGRDGVGHRFVRPVDRDRGKVIFDVLAPEGLGLRTRRFTLRPARTVEAPGTTQAFRRSEVVEVRVSGIRSRQVHGGRVRRPNPLGALIAKAAATTIAGRVNPDRDWQDAALLLTLIADPIKAANQCDTKDRRRLSLLEPLKEPGHPGWATLDDHAHRRGTATLRFLVD